MSTTEFTSLIKQTYAKWSEHEAPRLGASVAFYSVLSFAPLLLLTTAVIALVFGQSSAQGALINEAKQLIGDRGAETVESLLKNAQKPGTGAFASIVAFATLLFGASGVFVELQTALNIMWEAPAQTAGGFWGIVKQRLFSFGMVLSIGFLLLVSLILSTALAFIGKEFGHAIPLPASVMEALNFLVSFIVITILFALMFKYVPNAKVPWNDALLGGLVTALLFTFGKFLLGLYLGKASVGSTYGAAGSLVAVIVWIYYSAQIFFFGAEFTHVYAERKGAQVTPPKVQTGAAKSVQEPAQAAKALFAFAAEAAAGSAQPAERPIVAEPIQSTSKIATVNVTGSFSAPHLSAEKVNHSVPSRASKPKLLWALCVGVVLGRLLASSRHEKNW
jgi:membrane protein